MKGPVRARITVLVAAAVAAAIALAIGPITRAPSFHRYADDRVLLGLAHAGDVLSNLGFVVIALALGWRWWRVRAGARVPWPLVLATITSVGLLGVGSGLYHLAPDDARLALDFGPIGVALMLLLACVVADRQGPRAGAITAFVGVVLALVAVTSWYVGGGTSGGDMRWYVVLQAAGVLLPAILVAVAPGQIARAPIWIALGLFVVARALAARDAWWLEAIGVSGHSLKHVAASLAAGVALHAVTSARAGA